MHVDPRTTLKKGDDVYPDDYIATIAQTSLAAHLHFEIRLPNARHSPNTWALVGNPDNWCFNIDPKTGEVVYNGYYKDPQAMFDAGLRHPTDFIEENNKTPRTLAQACWKEYKIGDLFYSVPGHWKPGPETKDGVSTRMYYTEQGQTTFMIGVGDSLVKDYEPGKLRIVHYGMDGGEKIEESATASRTITIGHIGRMVGGFSRKIAGRPVTVCILRLTGNDNIPVENWSFALIENGKQYALSLFSRDRSFQTEIFAELVSRIHF
jgi:murein DD-endopeptidase MepM/ murein hydrolase activator NlpD